MSREEWLARRMQGIGGSDVSSILGLNTRFPAIELYYQKVGLSPQTTEENEAMFWGTRNEDKVLEIGQYYNFTSGVYIKDFNEGNKIRKVTKLRYMVTNPSHPHIIANLDGAVNFVPRSFKMDGPAEAKTISRQTAEKWENRVPPYHLTQLMTYCAVCKPMMKEAYANIFYLEDGNKFRGFVVNVVDSLVDQILTESEKFWSIVLKGREIMANVTNYDDRLRFLAEYEPQPDATEAYYEHLSELYKQKRAFTQIDGDDLAFFTAKRYVEIGKEINALDDKRQEHKNVIMKTLHDAGANTINFGEKGKVSWNKKLYVNVKG